MILKVLICRGLVVLSFYIWNQHNIAYQSKHNMRYNHKKNYFKQAYSSNQSIVIINYPPSLYVSILRKKIIKK